MPGVAVIRLRRSNQSLRVQQFQFVVFIKLYQFIQLLVEFELFLQLQQFLVKLEQFVELLIIVQLQQLFFQLRLWLRGERSFL